jgi:UTP--glucose-1-phosphate uridylyltransferase
MKIKGVIIAAGYGTRFLPATKTIPKEMLPLLDKPSIEFAVRELLDSGVEDIIIVTSRRKKVLEDYFDREMELEYVFSQKEARKKQKKLQWSNNVKLHFVRQKIMRGTAHAIFAAKEFVGNNPFIVLYPDDIFLASPPVSKQLIETYERTGKNVISVIEVTKKEISRFASIKATFDDEILVHDIIEKPAAEEAPSNLASMGRYLFLPEIFDIFQEIIRSQDEGEVFQTDGIQVLAKKDQVVACKLKATYLDTGVPLALLKSTIKYALTREDIKDDLISFLENLALNPS